MFERDLLLNKYYLWLVRYLRVLFAGMREMAGDSAYERYLQHCRQHHPESMPLDRKTFYDLRLEQKWSGVSRCC